MYKKFLFSLFLVLFFSVSLAQSPVDLSKYTFSHITSVLNDKVFKEIKDHIKTFELFPYAQEKAETLTADVGAIIIKYGASKDLIFKDAPSVALLAASTKSGEMMFYIQIRLNIIEYDDVYNGNPIMGHLYIFKNIFVAIKTKSVNT